MKTALRMSLAGLCLGLVCLACRQAALAGEAKEIPLTPENTKIEWIGTKPDGKHEGGFKALKGSVQRAGEDIKKIELEIDTNSLYSDNPNLTKHLKSADFFECLNFPKATFVATKIKAGADDPKATHTITGDLTLRNKTNSITFPATVSSADGFSLTSAFVISKKEFGMTFGAGKIDDPVKIMVSVKAK